MGALKVSIYSFLLFGFVSVLSVSLSNEEFETDVIVETTTGLVRGEQGGFIGYSDNPWYRFRKIPYAEPPLGFLRFEPPVPKLPWDGVLDVTEKGDICVQGTDPVQGSEDCLFVKIYTPEFPNKESKLPVVIWTYGGAFYTGSPDFDDGNPELLLSEDVIVVSFHYRVGVFGFLATEDKVLPGNVGIKDQILALQWIKDNIENFGGDPEKITLLGQSAGAASIAYLLQAPETKGLYSGVVMLSGSSLNSWSFTRNPLSFTKALASSLNVQTSNINEMVEKLKLIDAEEIQTKTDSLYKSTLLTDPLGGLPIGPVIEAETDGAVITGKSYDLLNSGQFNAVPIMIGHTSLEAATAEGLSSSLRLLLLLYGFMPGKLVPFSMNIQSDIQRNNIGNKIKTQYFGSSSLTSSDSKALKWISEDQFVRGIYESVKQYSKKIPVYYYSFSYEGGLWGRQNRPLPGVGHNEDLGYLFDFGFSGTATDYLVQSRYVRLITNFVKYRNPTPTSESILQDIQWPANTGDGDIKLLNITDTLEIVSNPYKDNMVFWQNIFNEYGTGSYDTY